MGENKIFMKDSPLYHRITTVSTLKKITVLFRFNNIPKSVANNNPKI